MQQERKSERIRVPENNTEFGRRRRVGGSSTATHQHCALVAPLHLVGLCKDALLLIL